MLRSLLVMCLLLLTRSVFASPELVLDRFHRAAASADGETYFAQMAEHGVFIGTDASERWSKAAFAGYAMPYFDKGRGWTYVPRDRHVQYSADGKVAWFDELLDNQKYGECRGTGVLERTVEGWQIVQYHLTIPMPNEIAGSLVEQIAQFHNSENNQ